MNLSLRTKLTLWSVSIVGVALVGLGVTLYHLLSANLLNSIDDSLLFYARSLESNATNTTLEATETPSAQTPQTEPETDSRTPFLSAQVIQFLDTSGRITQQVTEKPPGELFGNVQPVSLGNWQAVQRLKQPLYETVTVPRGQKLRVVTILVGSKDESFFISVGHQLDDFEALQQTILTVLVTSIPTALFFLGWGSWILVGGALKRVDRLTRTAQHIGENNLRERIEAGDSGDELTRLAETFNQMLARLDAAFERQKQFTADAAHELRTPLAVMRGELELALRRSDVPETHALTFGSLLEETLRLSTLVDDLLTLARSDSGELRLEFHPVDMTALCQEMYEYLLPLAESRELKFSSHMALTPTMISGDRQRLRQLVLNVLDNALKYTPAGGEVILQSRFNEAGAVEIAVVDNGPGIPVTDRGKIFDRFYRHVHTGGEKSGFGLGLAICKWIVQAHQGAITVTETPGGGTTFTLTFPSVQLPPALATDGPGRSAPEA
ncbi:MAG: HAMP domain-containing histidine kinase [Blastocatellia bacterium]|nr:HAMP domain-containing histidine kinase [Blastocatellia bacterium]